MPRLSLSCLGPFQVTLDGQPVTGFKSNKVRALLVYLAVEADRPHRREALAGLLWPDWPHRDALGNLRYALSDLRRTIGDRTAEPPYLLITRDSLQFNPTSDHWLDVATFLRHTESADLLGLEEAVALYRGIFLEGFSLSDSAPFEEWALFTQERLARKLTYALHHLAEVYEQRSDYERSQACARRQIELEPWDETAHRQLMRALFLDGQRSAALAHYETCRRLLADELSVEPSAETAELYEQIRNGQLSALTPVPVSLVAPRTRLPAFLKEGPPRAESPMFVARERELATLDGYLKVALASQGRVAFVIGEAGSGKTALIQEFARRAQKAHADLIVASGNCNAYTGIGDPYLPFREILALLTGDVEARWEAGAVAGEYARRLWNAIPIATQALAEAGPDLIDTFVPRTALLERATTYTQDSDGQDWLRRLEGLVQRKPISAGVPSPQQSDLFEQYIRVLQALARKVPLALVLDDLQWADLGSISLLFHLGRQLAGSRILLVGAYRPEEVDIEREGERHPLKAVVNEFQRDFGDITVNLRQAENRQFVEALLDSEPNRLGLPFREMLYRQTHGHPLFTIELLRGLQERGDLVQDSEGFWTEGPTLDWQTLPARVEAVIAERMGRLAQPLRAILQVACVEGEVFTAEVVARVQAAENRQVVGRLSRELDRTHRLVRAQAIEHLGSRRLSRYQFRNYLFQKYLYDSLDAVERAYLHEDVGNVMEELYGGPPGESAVNTATAAVAVQLAWHFQEAGIAEKAIQYLHQAGKRALHLSAYQEAISLLMRGLVLLMTLPDSPERAHLELALQLSLGGAWTTSSAPPQEGEDAFSRARELCRQMGETAQLSQVLGGLAVYYYVRAEHRRARDLGSESLHLAQQAGDPLLTALGHCIVGFTSFCLGEYTTALDHLEQTIAFYNPEQHHRAFVELRVSDTGTCAMAYAACCLWCLGYPDQALQRSEEVLALARELGHPFSLADVLSYGGCLLADMRRDASALLDHSEELLCLAREKNFSGFLGAAIQSRGKAVVMLGQIEEGMAQMREGMAAHKAVDVRLHLPGTFGALAEAYAKTGLPDEGLSELDKALSQMEQTDERLFQAELYRIRAMLLAMKGDAAGAETSLHQAIEVARQQQAKSWELRAATSLARLWQEQGRSEDARQVLEEVYAWFTEGFDTSDLREAKSLLHELG